MTTKPSRRVIILGVSIAALVCLLLAGISVWLAVIRPRQERDQRIAIATDFLEAYSGGDCARARAFLDPAEPLTGLHSPKLWNPETFCREYAIRIAELDEVQEARAWAGMSSAGWRVWFRGQFEITDYGVGPYSCSSIIIAISRRGGGWLITSWQEYRGGAEEYLVCVPLNTREVPPRAMPECYDTPGVSLELRWSDSTSIDIIPQGVDGTHGLEIFYRPTSGADFRGHVDLFEGAGGIWVENANGEIANINPMVTGHLVFTLDHLPKLPGGSMWEVRLAHPWGVACAQIPSQ